MSYSTDTWYILFGFFLASGNICYHWDTFFPHGRHFKMCRRWLSHTSKCAMECFLGVLTFF